MSNRYDATQAPHSTPYPADPNDTSGGGGKTGPGLDGSAVLDSTPQDPAGRSTQADPNDTGGSGGKTGPGLDGSAVLDSNRDDSNA